MCLTLPAAVPCEDLAAGRPESVEPKCQIALWVERFGWTEVVDDAYIQRCGQVLAALGTSALTREHVHFVCSRELSPTLFRLCGEQRTELQPRRERALVALQRHLSERARLIVSPAEAAETIAHETLCAVLDRLTAIASPDAFLGYCQVALHNKACKWLRREARRAAREVSLEALAEAHPERVPPELLADACQLDPARSVEKQHACLAVWTCIRDSDVLSDREKSVTRLRFQCGLAPEDIAAQLNVTRNAVDIAWSKARRKLMRDPKFLDNLRALGYDYRRYGEAQTRTARGLPSGLTCINTG